MPSAADIALEVLKAQIPGYQIYKLLERSMQQTEEAAASGDAERMQREAARHEFEMRMAERQAKVRQEVAIADRIRTAEEVEIEEFYDYSGKASAGLKADDKGITLGLDGQAARVSKRIYRFRGTTESIVEEIEAVLVEDSSPAKSKKAVLCDGLRLRA